MNLGGNTAFRPKNAKVCVYFFCKILPKEGKIMKRLRKILLSLILLLASFTNLSFASEEGDVLRVGMEVNYAPFNFSEVNEDNELSLIHI